LHHWHVLYHQVVDFCVPLLVACGSGYSNINLFVRFSVYLKFLLEDVPVNCRMRTNEVTLLLAKRIVLVYHAKDGWNIGMDISTRV